MTAESEGKARQAGQPDLLASLPAERPPASQPAPGIDPAAIEELLTEVRNLREQVAGLREPAAADRPALVPEALTRETLDGWGDSLVTRVAEAARPADAPGEDAAAALADHAGRIEKAAAKAATAAERIGGGLDSTADRVAAEIKEAVTRIEKGLAMTRERVSDQASLTRGALYDIETRVTGPRFGLRTLLVWLFFAVFGMLIESRIHILYLWLWAD